MPRTISQSQRFYYDELSVDEAVCIKNDLELYNRMFRTTYRKFYDQAFYGAFVRKDFQKQLKQMFGTNDYMPLSVIADVKSRIKTSIKTQEYHLNRVQRELKNIENKISKTEKRLIGLLKTLDSLINVSKGEKVKVPVFKGCGFTVNHKTKLVTLKDGRVFNFYLFEVQVLKVEIKRSRNRLKQLKDRMNRKKQEIINYSKHPRQICFGGKKLFRSQFTQQEYINNHSLWKQEYDLARNRRMSISGRRQGKYGNNLFKYDVDTNTMMYRGINKIVYLPVTFHYQKELLIKRVTQPHNTEGKAICYCIESKKDYFIIKAILEAEEIPPTTTWNNGVIGIDINVDHIALCEINKHGNILNTKVIPMNLENKTTNQRQWIIRQASVEVVSQCMFSNKTLIIEALQSRATRNAVKVEVVDPSYSSIIGKEKYSKSKGLSTHLSASYVIARRGMSFTD